MAPRRSSAAALAAALARAARARRPAARAASARPRRRRRSALRAALAGRRVLVCTIDPSRRLATSLGKGSLSGRPRAIDLKGMAPARGGALSAMVLDIKGTFDALVLRHTPDGARRATAS